MTVLSYNVKKYNEYYQEFIDTVPVVVIQCSQFLQLHVFISKYNHAVGWEFAYNLRRHWQNDIISSYLSMLLNYFNENVLSAVRSFNVLMTEIQITEDDHSFLEIFVLFLNVSIYSRFK